MTTSDTLFARSKLVSPGGVHSPVRAFKGVGGTPRFVRKAEGVWRVKAGARVRVRLTMVATSRRYHVALVDPLPAGLEASNPTLRVTGRPASRRTASQAARAWASPSPHRGPRRSAPNSP